MKPPYNEKKRWKEMQAGYRIESLEDLHTVCQHRRSVYVAWNNDGKQSYLAASFVLNYQAAIVRRMINAGMYLYQPQKKTRKPFERGTLSVLKL